MIFADVEKDKIDSLKKLSAKLNTIENPIIKPGQYKITMPALIAVTKFIVSLLFPYE